MSRQYDLSLSPIIKMAQNLDWQLQNCQNAKTDNWPKVSRSTLAEVCALSPIFPLNFFSLQILTIRLNQS